MAYANFLLEIWRGMEINLAHINSRYDNKWALEN